MPTTTNSNTINTPLGQLEYQDNQLLHLSGGVIGLPEADRFLLVENAEIEPLRWMVSTSVANLSLPVIDPRILMPGYELSLTPEQALRLEVDKEEISGLLPLAITVLAEPADASTANLKAPIVVNTRRMVAAQVVLVDADYPVDFPLLRSPLREE